MIWEFVPDVLVLLGFGGVLFILVRKSRSLSDEDVSRAVNETAIARKAKSWYETAVRPHLNARSIEQSLWTWMEKTLRSVRVANFRIENWVTARLEWVKAARNRERFDDDQYWFSVHKLLVEKKIEELFGSVPVTDLADPVKEELALKRKRKEPIEQWLNLVRWYLGRSHVSEARRVLILCWQKNPSDERVLALLEMLIVKTEEGGDVPMPKPVIVPVSEQKATPEQSDIHTDAVPLSSPENKSEASETQDSDLV